MGLSWLLAHWKPLAGALALAAAFAAGWKVRGPPPQPSLVLKQNASSEKASASDAETTTDKGPTRTVVDETVYDAPPPGPAPAECPNTKLIPVPMPGPVRVVRHTVIEQGPERVRTETVERAQEQEQQNLAMTVTPAAARLPRYAFAAGFEDVLGAQSPHLELGMRVLTIPLLDKPLWLRMGNTPARGLLKGTSLMVEIQF